jgi:acyl-CoA reductase-like NAD-dependent aldehyde dehydrogenase
VPAIRLQLGAFGLDHRHAFLQREQRALVAVDRHADHQPVDQRQARLMMSTCPSVMGSNAGIKAGAHRVPRSVPGIKPDVWNPATGEVQAKVALASTAEIDRRGRRREGAQPAWAAMNPQRRARVMMEFVRLLHRDMDKLAEALSREHGKTIPDAKGDVQRGLEVVEFCIGAPHLLKGEFTDSAGPGIDMYSMRQPLAWRPGITPFNFPAMIPMWKMAPASPAATPSS